MSEKKPDALACSNCRFSLYSPDRDVDYLCRRRAPTVESLFPQVGASWWCGDHEPKEPTMDRVADVAINCLMEILTTPGESPKHRIDAARALLEVL